MRRRSGGRSGGLGSEAPGDACVLAEVGQALAGKLVVSIAAGVTTAWIRERIAAPEASYGPCRIRRLLVRAGATALAYQADLAAE